MISLQIQTFIDLNNELLIFNLYFKKGKIPIGIIFLMLYP